MKPPATPRNPTRLKVSDDKGFEKIVLVDGDLLVIGSDASCGLALPAGPGGIAEAAPRHAVIVKDGTSHVLKDESGPRGTRVNGRPIRTTRLRHGDVISIGSCPLRIEFLVEGSRASDHDRRQVRRLLELLAALHEAPSVAEIVRRVEEGARELLGADSAHLRLGPGGAAARSRLRKDRLSAPVPCGEGSAGTIETGPREARPWSESDLETLEAVARHVGIALSNLARRGQELPAIPSGSGAAAR